jgi:serine protease AprX
MRDEGRRNVKQGSMRRWFSAALVVALAVLAPAMNQPGGVAAKTKSKLDRVLQRALDNEDGSRQRVIVRPRSGHSHAVADRVSKRGHRIEAAHRRLGSFTATVDGDGLRALSADPDVENVSVDALLTASRAQADGTMSGEPNVLLASLGLSGSEYEGEKVTVAVIDSGLEKSEDLSGGRGDRFFDFTVDGRRADAYDDYGHGTHVATLIGGAGKKSEVEVTRLEKGKPVKRKLGQFQGVAPKARIISLKVLDGDGRGLTSSVLQALEFAIEHKDDLKIDIINLSLGHPIYELPETDPLVRAVEDAVREGIVVVTSAGNYGISQETGEVGYAGITSPGNAPSAITVGAIDTQQTADHSDDTVARYSSRGPSWYSGLAKPDLVAPGSRLVAVGAYNGRLYVDHPERQVHGNASDRTGRYLRLSGTSMAAAVTSGVVALMIDANRQAHEYPLTPNIIKAILEFTALPLQNADPLSQ